MFFFAFQLSVTSYLYYFHCVVFFTLFCKHVRVSCVTNSYLLTYLLADYVTVITGYRRHTCMPTWTSSKRSSAVHREANLDCDAMFTCTLTVLFRCGPLRCLVPPLTTVNISDVSLPRTSDAAAADSIHPCHAGEK